MSYYNRRPYRANYTTTTSDRTTSEAQAKFVTSLVEQVGTASQGATPAALAAAQDAIAALPALGKLLSDQWAEVPAADTSTVIDGLKAVLAVVRAGAAPTAAPELPGLPPALRVFKTLFNSKRGCVVCHCDTVANVDWCVELPGKRFAAYCVRCATSAPREAQAQADAAQAEAEAEHIRKSLLHNVAVGLARQAFKAMGLDGHRDPVLRFALLSVTGNNDLDFFTVRISSYRGKDEVRVRRVIGGHADQSISLDEGVGALKRLTDGNIRAAATLYGQELGECCLCGRHLTDDESRAAGIGPTCRTK